VAGDRGSRPSSREQESVADEREGGGEGGYIPHHQLPQPYSKSHQCKPISHINEDNAITQINHL